MTVSVIIPAYNEEKNITACLEALAKQDTTHDVEVIVVDNNSSDKTGDIARSFKNKMNIRVLVEKKQGRGAARKKGCAEAKGSILFSTDADTVVPKNWITQLTRALEKDPKVVAVTTTSIINDCGDVANAFYNAHVPIIMHGYRQAVGHYWLNGCSFAIRKKTYLAAGGFSDDSDALEDVELSNKVHKLGDIKFLKSPAVLVSGRRFRENGLLKGLFTYVQSYAKKFVLKKKGVPLSNPR